MRIVPVRLAMAFVAGAALSSLSPLVAAQTAPPGAVIGVGNFSHIVASLERSLEFYRDVIGLQVDGAPRVFSGDLAMRVGNTPGAQSLFTTLRVPGSPLGVEIIEYRNTERQPANPRFQDPGAASLALTVRNMDGIVARATKARAHINTLGGVPLTMEGSGRVIVLRDPDGFFVELYEPFTIPSAEALNTSNVLSSSLEIMVDDTDGTLRLYKEALGFDPRTGTFDGTKLYMDIGGTPGAQFKRSTSNVPGTSVTMAFLEYKDIDRKPLRTRFQDPGTPVLQLRVRGIHAVTNAWKRAGGEVVTAGGEPVNLGNLTLVVLRDPNNLMLELIETP